MRSLVLVLGDQLDLESSAFDGFEPQVDAVWMAEVADEATHVWSSKPRTTVFLAAMRHFAMALARNPRMALQVKNLARLANVQKQAVSERAAAIRRGEIGTDAGVST